VNVGDATGEYEGNRMSVSTSANEQGLLSVRVEPGVVTPNGDGCNEEARIVYTIYEITGRSRVEVGVYDLSGRRVRQVYGGEDGIGEYVREWDGRDESGRLVPPGIYFYRVSLDADRGQTEKVGLLNLAF